MAKPGDQAFLELFEYCIGKVFQDLWSPADFSDFMDTVVDPFSCVSLECRSAVFSFLEDKHRWIKELSFSQGDVQGRIRNRQAPDAGWMNLFRVVDSIPKLIADLYLQAASAEGSERESLEVAINLLEYVGESVNYTMDMRVWAWYELGKMLNAPQSAVPPERLRAVLQEVYAADELLAHSINQAAGR